MPADVPARHNVSVGHDRAVMEVPVVAAAGADQLDPFHITE